MRFRKRWWSWWRRWWRWWSGCCGGGRRGNVMHDGKDAFHSVPLFGPGNVSVERCNLDLRGERRGELDDLLELALRVAHHRRQFHRVLLQVLYQLELCAQIRVGLGILLDLHPP